MYDCNDFNANTLLGTRSGVLRRSVHRTRVSVFLYRVEYYGYVVLTSLLSLTQSITLTCISHSQEHHSNITKYLTLASRSNTGGALYWKEMASFNASQWTLFPIGVLVTLYGVYLMSSRDMAIEEDEEVLLDDKGSKQDEADVKLARPRFATEHPHLAKALLPFTLLDNPVLRSESDAMTPMVRGSKRHLSRKSRMVSRTGVFMPLALDHGMCSSASVRA